MPTLFLEINALQPPISIGNDSSNRAMLSFNVTTRHVGSPSIFEEQIASIISSAGLGTLGTNMWYGSVAQLPQKNDGPLVSIIATGGLSSIQSHNGDQISRPSVQIIVRATSYVAARNRANEIYAVLNGKHNLSV